MIQYLENGDLALFNGFKFRLDKRTGYYLSSKRIGERRKRLHIAIWEYHNGDTPKGCCVHHIDENKRNNNIENLKLMDDTRHKSDHATKWHENNPDMTKEITQKASAYRWAHKQSLFA